MIWIVPITKDIGAFVRWLLKGCKTNLKDEMNGNFEKQWLVGYEFENYIIGIITVIIILGSIIWLFF